MSLFGKLDAATIPSNPFHVDPGDYSAEVIKAEYRTTDKGRQLRITYKINDEESEFFENQVTQFFNLIDPDMTNEQFELLPPNEKRKIKGALSSLKRSLCGSDGNESQRGLGVDPEDLNDESWDPATLVGKLVDIGVRNFGQNNTGVGVQWVNLQD